MILFNIWGHWRRRRPLQGRHPMGPTNIPHKYNARSMCAILFRNLDLLKSCALTFEYSHKYCQSISDHTSNSNATVLDPDSGAIVLLRPRHQHFTSNMYQISGTRLYAVFSLFARSRARRLEGPEDGRDEDDGDDGGSQDVPKQEQFPVLRVGGVHGYDFFYGSTTQFWENMNIKS